MQDPANIFDYASAAMGGPSFDRTTTFLFALMTEQYIYRCVAILTDGATPASSKRWSVNLQSYYQMNWPVPNTNLYTHDRMSRNEPTTKMIYFAVQFSSGARQDQIMAHYSYNYRT
jgi:hypothetical protein